MDNWLLVCDDKEIPRIGTYTTYYNYVDPLIQKYGYPLRIENSIGTDAVKEYISEHHLKFGLELVTTKQCEGFIPLESDTFTLLGFILNDSVSSDQIYLEHYKGVWGRHPSFSRKIPEGLFFPNYERKTNPKKYGISYIGHAKPEIADVLIHLVSTGCNLHLWGFGWEEYKPLRKISHGVLPFWEKQRVISSSIINLNFDPIDDISYTRYEIAASGGREYDIDLNKISDSYLKKITQDLLEVSIQKEVDIDASRDNKHFHVPSNDQLFKEVDEILKHTDPKLVTCKDYLASLDSCPKVSVICYAYNQSEYIAQMIESVLGQKFKNLELFILDDGSTDDMAEIIHKYSCDDRLRYHYQKNIGRNLDSFDRLIEISLNYTQGEFVAFIGGDDIFYPDKLLHQIDLLESRADLGITYTDFKWICNEGCFVDQAFDEKYTREKEGHQIHRELLEKIFIFHPTVVMKRDTIRKMGGFQTPFASDVHFWLKSSLYTKMSYVECKGILYRHHQKGSSTGKREDSLCSKETPRIYNLNRLRHTVLDVYPEIESLADSERAMYDAYIDMSSRNKFYAQIVVNNAEKALDYHPYGLEAWNHLLITFIFQKDLDNIQKVIHFILQNEKHLKTESRWEEFQDVFLSMTNSVHALMGSEKAYDLWMECDRASPLYQKMQSR